MNFRKGDYKPQLPGFQIAPLVDILLVVLVFFIVTWNSALEENELDVKIPTAKNAKAASPVFGQVIVNIRPDGTFVVNKKPLGGPELLTRLQKLAALDPDQAIIVRGDEKVEYSHIVSLLDICRNANIWNILFATSKAAGKE